MHSELLLILVVAAALLFDFTNGFHDTANVVASVISTRALSPRRAVALATVLNFLGALLSLKVAATIATGIVALHLVDEQIAFAALAGAIAWNLVTWAHGLPSSSSHALIGALLGAVVAAVGGGVHWHGVLVKVLIPALVAPLAAFAAAAVVIVVIYRAAGRLRPGRVNRALRLGEILSSSALSLAHGTNDAQKTMGIIGVALVAHGGHRFHVPLWVVISAAGAMGLGTWAGGWRIIRTVGSRIIRMDPAQGFTAQGVGATVILLSSALGYPLSSTQVISGGVVGAGAGKSASAVRWGVAWSIIVAWLLTLPLAAVCGALVYAAISLFASPLLGPLLILSTALVLAAWGVRRRWIFVRSAVWDGGSGRTG